MLTKEMIDFANQNPACNLATSHKGTPRVRGMLLWYADEEGFIFHTARIKELAVHLKENPRGSIHFFNPGSDPASGGTSLRVEGAVEFIEDEGLEKRLLEERPFLKEIGTQFPEAGLLIFRICKGEAFFWRLSDNMKEKTLPRVKF